MRYKPYYSANYKQDFFNNMYPTTVQHLCRHLNTRNVAGSVQ